MNFKEYLQKKIEENREDLTDSESLFLINFSNSNYLNYKNHSINELAKDFYTSTGVVNRAFAKINHKSWSYFRPLIDILFETLNIESKEVSNSDESITIKYTNELLNGEVKQKIIELYKQIKKVKNVVLISDGYSQSIASFLERGLRKSGFHTTLTNAFSNLDLIRTKQKYLVIFVSCSMANKTTFDNFISLIKKYEFTNNWVVGGSKPSSDKIDWNIFKESKKIYPNTVVSATQFDKDHPTSSAIILLSYITYLLSVVNK